MSKYVCMPRVYSVSASAPQRSRSHLADNSVAAPSRWRGERGNLREHGRARTRHNWGWLTGVVAAPTHRIRASPDLEPGPQPAGPFSTPPAFRPGLRVL